MSLTAPRKKDSIGAREPIHPSPIEKDMFDGYNDGGMSSRPRNSSIVIKSPNSSLKFKKLYGTPIPHSPPEATLMKLSNNP